MADWYEGGTSSIAEKIHLTAAFLFTSATGESPACGCRRRRRYNEGWEHGGHTDKLESRGTTTMVFTGILRKRKSLQLGMSLFHTITR